MSARAKSYLLLFFAFAIWGIAGPVIKHTLDYFEPQDFLLYRFALSALFALLSLFFVKKINFPKSPTQRIFIIIYSLLNTTVGLGLLFLGYKYTSALSASIVNAIYPLMISVVGVLFLREHVTKKEKVGMTIALVATLATILDPSPQSSTLVGNLLVIASLLIGVVGAVMAKLLLRTQLSAFVLTQITFIVGFISWAPIVFITSSPALIATKILQAPLNIHLSVWYMAFLSGTLAYYLWHIGQKTIEIGETAIFSYLYPIFTLPLSYFWLKENITPLNIICVVVITLGVVLALSRPSLVPHQSGKPHPKVRRR
jgi:drug/metabolite transporter (DMT)-like permease